jgi:hypothetical protein
LKLGPLAENFKAKVPDHGRNNGDCEVFHGDDIYDCRQQRLIMPSHTGELAHQQVRVEQENDKGNLYGGSQMAILGRMHGF